MNEQTPPNSHIKFLVLKINSLSSSEKNFPWEPFIKAQRMLHLPVLFCTLGSLGARPPVRGCRDWLREIHQSLETGRR